MYFYLSIPKGMKYQQINKVERRGTASQQTSLW